MTQKKLNESKKTIKTKLELLYLSGASPADAVQELLKDGYEVPLLIETAQEFLAELE